MCLVLALLGLRCYAHTFSSCGEWGLLFVVVFRLLMVVAFLVEGAQASVVEVHRLSCSMVCGIFLDNVPNPCLLHWQAYS